MTDQNPEGPVAVVIDRWEVRQAIAKEPGAQSYVLFAGMFADGGEVLMPLTPAQARVAATTMLQFADEIEGRDRPN